ncbi:unnamed protein product, partial [Brassica rapa subsp. trilocularis]
MDSTPSSSSSNFAGKSLLRLGTCDSNAQWCHLGLQGCKDDGIVVYDFFSDDDDQARSIRLPDRMQRYHPHHSDASRCFEHCLCPCYKMICSTSQGFFVFIEARRMTGKEEGYNLKVWRLIESDYSWEWDKAWEINMASIGIGFESVPMAINNFDVDIIYLWSLQHIRYVACNV